jgi:hypothetical protein
MFWLTAKNHKSASENKQEVYKKLAIESLKERIAGPFLNPPFQNLVCSICMHVYMGRGWLHICVVG